ncbi:unnamed protein product [Symbiodinium microadriaticum]|nr:unnamed protein product [Symbiodinium microadriaticum]
MAIDGNVALIGAEREDEDENESNTLSGAGSAYFYEICENPEIPEITADMYQVCAGEMVTLSFSGSNLNGANSWEWYSVTCAGNPEGSGTSIQVNPMETTTYFVRGESGCETSNTCAFITIEVFEECPETDILSFDVPDQVGDEIINLTDHTVKIEVELETDRADLTPTIVTSTNGSIDPASGVSQDFTNPLTYTVTAENDDTQEWTVTVTNVSNTATDILSFSFEEETGDASIDVDNHTVTIEVEHGSDLTDLTPTITVSSGATIDPESGVTGDFSNDVAYTVTAEDEATQQEWTVTVTEEAAPKSMETDVLTFSFSEQTGAAVIDAENHTITIEVQNETDLTALVPTITVSNGAAIDPASGVAGDFSDAVVYTVTAEDETAQQEWTVTVTEEEKPKSSETDILTFSFVEQTSPAVINTENHTISIQVKFETDLSSLTPSLSVSDGATYFPTGALDFNQDVIITVTAEDGSTQQDWTVHVTEEEAPPNTATEILSFSLTEQVQTAIIDADNHTVDITVNPNADLTGMEPDVTVSEGATYSPSGPVDFSSPVPFMVTAEDEVTTQEWKVTVKQEVTTGFGEELDEIAVIKDWVNSGGSLFLIADHMPLGGCAEDLAAAFGFEFTNGFVVDTTKEGNAVGTAVFTKENGLLFENSITNGRNSDEKVSKVVSFMGQAFKIPDGAQPLTVFDENWINLLPRKAWEFDESTPRQPAVGWYQGAYMKFGEGRIVMSGEAAMFSAQLAGPDQVPMGMNVPEAEQNYQFLLNIIHWLDGQI